MDCFIAIVVTDEKFPFKKFIKAAKFAVATIRGQNKVVP